MKWPLFRPVFSQKKNAKMKVYPGKLCRISKCSASARDRRFIQPIWRKHLTPFHPVFTKKENPKMKLYPGKFCSISKCLVRTRVGTVRTAAKVGGRKVGAAQRSRQREGELRPLKKRVAMDVATKFANPRLGVSN